MKDFSKELDKVRFLPWVGENYENGGIFKKRILVLGESHYCGSCDRKMCEDAFHECCRDYTQNTILKFLNKPEGHENWMKTNTKFEHSLVGKSKTTKEETIKIWNSIAFYNFLQYALEEPRQAGEYDAYDKAEEPFFQVLDMLKPELIIAWGKTRLYDNMPGGERWIDCENLVVENYAIPNGKYRLSNGDAVPIVFINHPSSRYNLKFWYNVIKNFLK